MRSQTRNLPPPMSSFVGRERELAEVRSALERHRLVTLTGPGGVGKTRLAVEVASRAACSFEDGVRLAELAGVSNPDLVPETVAQTFGLPGQREADLLSGIVRTVADSEMLLVLDNCEHLVGSCAALAGRMLAGCPRLRILATSREPLRITGEQVWPVAPLATDGEPQAVQLFEQRARAAQPSVDLDHAITEEICRRLDGLPLAIELAAPWVTTLSLKELLARLGELSSLDAAPRGVAERHRSLSAVVGWSYRLLAEDQATLFRRLAVFRGGFTFDAAETVAGASLPGLRSLVEKSLVVAEANGDAGTRYGLLETVRGSGLSLMAADEAQALADRHATYFLRLTEAASRTVNRAQEQEFFDRLDRERDNVRGALTWALECDAEVALRLASSMAAYWWVRGQLHEGRHWLERALAAPGTAYMPTRARAHVRAGVFAQWQGDFEAAERLADEGVAAWRQLGDGEGLADALYWRGAAARLRGDITGAQADVHELMSLIPGLTEQPRLDIQRQAGLLARDLGDYTSARLLLGTALDTAEEEGAARMAANVRIALTLVALNEGQVNVADEHVRQALPVCREQDDRWHVALGLEAAAAVAAMRGEAWRALHLGGAAAAVRQAIGARPSTSEEAQLERWLAPARRALDTARADAAWEEGWRLSIDEALVEALQPIKIHAPAPGRGLTARQWEVARLVARGLTNAEIARELVISERTAEGHVERIREQLGFRSRAQIAGWVGDLGRYRDR